MLIYETRNTSSLSAAVSSIHNRYERLVFDAMRRRRLDVTVAPDDYADIACVALNQLPARYIRHDVDLVYHLSQEAALAEQKRVDEALDAAIGCVEVRRRDPERAGGLGD